MLSRPSKRQQFLKTLKDVKNIDFILPNTDIYRRFLLRAQNEQIERIFLAGLLCK